jgi:hypothetical protein
MTGEQRADVALTHGSVASIAAAARKGSITLANDPAMRHYAPQTLALIYLRTIDNLAGAGDLHKAAERMATDPALDGIPIEVVQAVMGASFRHFALALKPDAAL